MAKSRDNHQRPINFHTNSRRDTPIGEQESSPIVFGFSCNRPVTITSHISRTVITLFNADPQCLEVRRFERLRGSRPFQTTTSSKETALSNSFRSETLFRLSLTDLLLRL